MPHVIINGNTGKDAEYKTTQSGSELCTFSVADEAGYGDNKETIWFDVTSWGKGSQGLANALRKGSKVNVIGELSTREYNGKTYLQCRADKIKIHSTPGQSGGGSQGGGQGGGSGSGGSNGGGSNYDDIDDDIPF